MLIMPAFHQAPFQEMLAHEGMDLTTLNSVDQLRFELTRHLFHAILAFDASTHEPAGFALYSHKYTPNGGRLMHLSFFYAREPYRGQGLGRTLLRELAVVAKREQLCKIEWLVREENAEARRFYAKVWLNSGWEINRGPCLQMGTEDMSANGPKHHLCKLEKEDIARLAGFEVSWSRNGFVSRTVGEEDLVLLHDVFLSVSSRPHALHSMTVES